MERADCVNECALDMCAGFFGDPHRHFQVTDVVQRVKDPDDSNAIVDGPFDEFGHHIIGVMVVAENVLSAQQHLNRCLFAVTLDDAQSFPGIFVEKAQGAVKSRATPSLQRKVANIVELLQHPDHVGGAHARGSQRLMAVPQNGFHNFYRLVAHGNPPYMLVVININFTSSLWFLYTPGEHYSGRTFDIQQ